MKTTSLEGVEVPDRGPAPLPADVVAIGGSAWTVRGVFWIAVATLGVLVWIAFENRWARAEAHADADQIHRDLIR